MVCDDSAGSAGEGEGSVEEGGNHAGVGGSRHGAAELCEVDGRAGNADGAAGRSAGRARRRAARLCDLRYRRERNSGSGRGELVFGSIFNLRSSFAITFAGHLATKISVSVTTEADKPLAAG